MATSKAAWRAFEQVSEPGDPSTWVWLGRSCPQNFFYKSRWPIPRTFPGGVPGPFNPVFDPVIPLADRPYHVTVGGTTLSTLAWDSTQTIDGVEYRWVIQQWVDDAGTYCAVNWRQGSDNDLSLGFINEWQKDGRNATLNLFGYATYTGSGLISTVTMNGNAHAQQVQGDAPHWFIGGANMDMFIGPWPASITLNWL